MGTRFIPPGQVSSTDVRLLLTHMAGIVIRREELAVQYPYVRQVRLTVRADTAYEEIPVSMRRVRLIGMQYASAAGHNRHADVERDVHGKVRFRARNGDKVDEGILLCEVLRADRLSIRPGKYQTPRQPSDARSLIRSRRS